MAKYHITAIVNGEESEYLCEPQETLLDVLRDQVGLTGTKEGCSSGDCAGGCRNGRQGHIVNLAADQCGSGIGHYDGCRTNRTQNHTGLGAGATVI